MNKQPKSMAEQIAELRPDTVKPAASRSTDKPTGWLAAHPEVIRVSQNVAGEYLVASLDTRIVSRLRTTNIFYLELRRKLRLLTGDESWAIRYASQVSAPLVPLLYSTRSTRILIDPMSPYRDPVRALAAGEITLFELPSQAGYFHSREALRDLSVLVDQKGKP